MRILITGASGFLGRRLVKVASQAGYRVWGWTSPRTSVETSLKGHVTYLPVDLTNPVQIAEAYSQIRPMTVIHAAALSTIAECHRDPILAFRVNAEATRQLVGLCVADIARLVYVSTDLVFDGRRGNYSEDDPPQPLSLYGKSKLDGERAVIQHPGLLVARLSWLVGRGSPERPRFLDEQIASLQTGKPITLFSDEWRTPLCIDTAAQALVTMAIADVSGVLHLGGPQRLSRYEMGCILARQLGCSQDLVQAITMSEKKAVEPRPHDVSLDSSQWRRLMPEIPWPTFAEALQRELVS